MAGRFFPAAGLHKVLKSHEAGLKGGFFRMLFGCRSRGGLKEGVFEYHDVSLRTGQRPAYDGLDDGPVIFDELMKLTLRVSV